MPEASVDRAPSQRGTGGARLGVAGGQRGGRHPRDPAVGRGRGNPNRGEGGGRGRAQRGDVRAAALILLAEQPMHGYQLMNAIAERTHGAWRPSPGAVYPTIAQLEDEGLVTVTVEPGRKLVALTEAGQQYLATNPSAAGDPFALMIERGAPEHDLRTSVAEVHAAARTVGMSGSGDQIAAAQKVLHQARRALYLILADGEPTIAEPDAKSDTDAESEAQA